MKYIETKIKGQFVADNGNIYSDYTPGKMTLKKKVVRKGKVFTNARLNGSKRYLNVMKEVADAFVPNPDNLRYALPIDGDNENTRPENIYWSANNGMNYKDFAKKKEGMFYKDFTGSFIGNYIVVEDKGEELLLSCSGCGDNKVIDRKSSRYLHVCSGCAVYPLDISSLYSAAFYNWKVLKENGTESEKTQAKKYLL